MMDIIDKFRLNGKKSLVTGAGSGIGCAFASALAEAGADVAVIDIDFESASRVSEEIKKMNVDSIAIKCDISDRNDIKNMIEEIKIKWKRLDIAVNNAGISVRSNAEDLPIHKWDEVFNLNLRGSFLCAQEEAKVMIPQRYGKIIFTTSISASIVNIPNYHVAYGASKAGVEHLIKALAVEWIKYGIYVNGICPGAVYTPFVEKAEDLRKLIKFWENLYPIKRLGRVEELKGAVVYLASDASTFMVGHSMVLDGGYTLL